MQTDLAGRTSYVRRDAAWWVGGRVLDETNEIGTGLTLGFVGASLRGGLDTGGLRSCLLDGVATMLP